MFKLFCTVVDSYEQQDYLVVVSDISETAFACCDYRIGETVELHLPDGSCIQTRSNEVLFDSPADRPFCLALQGLKKDDVPIGTQVWIDEKRPVRKSSRCSYYRPKGEAQERQKFV